MGGIHVVNGAHDVESLAWTVRIVHAVLLVARAPRMVVSIELHLARPKGRSAGGARRSRRAGLGSGIPNSLADFANFRTTIRNSGRKFDRKF